jgi:hypothetical protein
MTPEEAKIGNRKIIEFLGFKDPTKQWLKNWVIQLNVEDDEHRGPFTLKKGKIYNGFGNPILIPMVKGVNKIYEYKLTFQKGSDIMNVLFYIGGMRTLEKDGEYFDWVIQNVQTKLTDYDISDEDCETPVHSYKKEYAVYIGRVGDHSINLGKISSARNELAGQAMWDAVLGFIDWYNTENNDKQSERDKR